MVFTHKIDFYSKIRNYLKNVLAHIIEYLIKIVLAHIIECFYTTLNYVKNGMEGKCKGIKRVQSASIMRADVAFLYFDSLSNRLFELIQFIKF